jgi:hypothetical protein
MMAFRTVGRSPAGLARLPFGSGGMIMANLGLQLPQEVFKFRPPRERRREKIKHVAF